MKFGACFLKFIYNVIIMDFLELIQISLKALRTNKIRSFLTMLGIIIGVFSVIILVSVGAGLQSFITGQFENLGSNIIIVMPGKLLDESGNYSSAHGPPNFAGSKLNYDLVRGLKRLGRPLIGVTGRTETPITASRLKSKTVFTTVMGVTEDYSQVRNTKAQEGRFIDLSDINSGKKVAVIGPSLAEKLFKNEDAIGKDFRLGEYKFKVIGIVEKKGGGFGVDTDNTAYIPISAAQRIFNLENFQVIDIEIDSKENIEKGIALTKSYLSKRLNDDEFSVLDQSQLLGTIDSILGAITTALGAIAAISLLVGGIGIMNIMLVSVTERTHEIGLRKAVGARPMDIAIQFLIESIFLSITGGLIGILLAYGTTIIINKFFQTVITLWSVILAFGISSLIGIIFGVAPAIRASRLNPIDALRYE